ncbi:MAG TPA: YtxH domain-containing protein [Candidatus Polarisedimenticolia bacterium]|jgi:YtxH-like protein|nr:YtxH domain-containing protein [Candidatus Polarisedimenticolia bacterium]
MNNLIRSMLKTAVYFLDQTSSFTNDVRGRVADGVDRVSDRVSDLREQAEDMYSGGDHTVRNVLTFVAGVGVGVGVAMLFAPASGEETRSQIGDRVQDIGDRVRERFSTRTSTGTEGR